MSGCQECSDCIVLVDDEPMILCALSAFLEIEGYNEVHCFEDGREAVAFVQQQGCDLVICDMLMPQIDGIEVLSRMRSLDPRIPRILLTGYADRESAVRAINQAGLFNYLEKPWANEQLGAVVRNALQQRRLLKCLSERAAELDIANGRLQELESRILRAFG
jgi:DNA-binding NtrC family response regulator